MAEPLSFKDFIVVNYTQSDDDLLAYQAHKRHRGTVGEACWQGYTQKGMKPKNGKMVPNCVPEDSEKNEVFNGLTLQGRRALSRAAKRRKARLKLARKKQLRKTAQKPVLQKRATKNVRNALFKKLAGGKGRKEVSPARRKNIEKRLKRMSTRIGQLSRRAIPDVRKIDRARKVSG